MNRRNFIKGTSASLMASSLFSMGQALAKNTRDTSSSQQDYKALVCVFLYGGMDNHDTIIPYDTESYLQWAQIRQSLLQGYATKREIENLNPINVPNRFGNRQFALPPEMPGIQSLYQQGRLAVVGNVGPLEELTTRSALQAQTAKLPSRLFSHNDQQSTWMSGTTEGAQYGWAGQLNDEMINAGLTTPNTFSAITTSGGELLLTGSNTTPYNLQGSRALSIDFIEESEEGAAAALIPHFSAQGHQALNYLEQDLASKINHSYVSNQQFNEAINNSTPFSTVFPASRLGSQLQGVCKAIAAKEQLQTERQIFVVAMGGFDTHSGQAKSLPQLQAQIDNAFVAFDNAMIELGLSESVTLFSASDFGRTLAINGDGTDHGWGAHHFVMGGAVNGGTVFGDIPVAQFNHELDAGSGRLIPTMAVDQYAASLGRWLGLSDSALDDVFPNRNQFGELPAIFK